MPKSSISTMWAIGRFDRAADFVSQARAIGFDQIELNHQVTIGMVQEYRALKTAGKVEVSSVHAPCPKWQPKQYGPMPEISSLDEIERTTAVALIKTTIDLAVEFRAEAVIVHAGRVEMDFELERSLRHLYQNGRSNTEEYRRAKENLEAARASKSEHHLNSAITSLREIAEYAAARGIQLGLENRYHYYEIPLPEELSMILDNLDRSTVFYWHDLGHAQGLALLGLVRLENWLPVFHERTLGLHLHDAIGLKDHRVAGIGEIDIAGIRPLIQAAKIRVCEFDSDASPQQVQVGYNYLKRIGIY